jgi:hypothetical protein
VRKYQGNTNRREGQRFSINAPVALTIGTTDFAAYTLNMSSRGLYFYAASSEGLSIGQEFDFVIKFPPEITLSTWCLIRCRGRLVRMENTSNGLTGMAAEIIQYSIPCEDETSV